MRSGGSHLKRNQIGSARYLIFSFLFLLSCNHSSSRLTHKLDELTWSSESFQWARISKDEWLKEQDFRRSGPVNEILNPPSVSQELNRILKTIDQKARELYPSQLINTPTPQVLVINDEGVFAEALSASVCVHAESQKEGATQKVAYLRFDASGWLSEEDPKFECPKSAVQLSDLAPLISSFNKNVDPSCRVENVGGVLKIPKTCDSVEFNSEKIVYEAAAPVIKITAGLVKKVNEPQMFAILAHELAHYYRSHTFWEDTDKFGFFYFRDQVKSGERPQSDLEGKAKQLSLDLGKVVFLRLVAKQFPEESLPGILAVFLSDPDTQTKLSTFPGCEFLGKGKNDEAVLLDLSRFILSGSILGPDNLPFYQSLTGSFETCLKRNSPFQPEIKDAIDRGISLIFESREVPFAFSGFDDLKGKYFSSYEEKVLKRSTLLERARQEGLSWYTTEQEADEMSLELLNHLGINPSVSPKALYAVSSSRENRDLNGLTEDQCLVLQENGWKVEGRDLNLFYGDLNDPHHSTCFRQWNMDLEVKTHQYRGPYVFLPASSWDVMQNELGKVVISPGGGRNFRGQAYSIPCGYSKFPRKTLREGMLLKPKSHQSRLPN
jgi:Zn-dependent protease with chaperone function